MPLIYLFVYLFVYLFLLLIINYYWACGPFFSLKREWLFFFVVILIGSFLFVHKNGFPFETEGKIFNFFSK